MARMIGQGKSWLLWVAGFLCAMVFGRDANAGQPALRYGVNVRPPVAEIEQPKPAASLEESPDWKLIVEAWRVAKPLADSGKSTTAERKEAEDKLQAAKEAGDRLVKAGLLAAAEAGLLAAEEDKIRADMCVRPPTDFRGTCYLAMGPRPPAFQSFDRLSKRLPLLEELAKGGRVHGAVMDKVLATIEADVATLSDEKKLAELKDKQAEAEKTRDAVKTKLDEIKKLLAGGKPSAEKKD